MKNNKGITLIALVITIIVLLILAGVAIAMLTGENSILTRASDSAVVNEIAAKKDRADLAAVAGITDDYENKYVASSPEAKTAAKYTEERLTTEFDGDNGPLSTAKVTPATETTPAKIEIVANDTEKAAYLKATGTVQTNGTITWVNSFSQK